ncbi:tail fiber assembly protein [Pseudomonas aylmerensis]|nr:phage tail assembly chaperone [Pseudomonas aylmerensis]
MSFAVRNDGVYRCRSIGGPEELLPGEVFSDVYVPLLSVGVDVDAERSWRDGELASLMWLRERHRDQLEISRETTLSAEQFTELLEYMQDLRDWPQSPDFPDIEQRPVPPAWIAEQIQ